MDTPSFPPPRDATEQDILDNLVAIRDKLQLLKHNRKTYMQKQDIIPLYQDTIEQVRRLTEARPQDQVLEKNRVDRVLDSCFLLLSLSFMTIGQNNTAPAAYALTVTTERLLDHLAEVDLFSAKDLESLEETLTTLTRNVKNAAAEQSPYLVTLLLNRLDSCKKSLVKLQKRLEKYEKPLPKVHETLISILRSISWANTRSKFSASEVKKLRKQLTDIEQDIKDGKYKKEDGEWPSGSVEVDNLLRKCLLWADIVLDRAGEIPDSFKPMYSRLLRIKNDLDKLSITGRWALREADLYDYTRELDSIDEQRVNGNWLDEDGREAELYVQRTMLYLVRRSYGYIYFLMLSSKPVSEALLPIFNQLQTLKTCLVEVKNSGGVSSVRELYPYSMKLHSIDNLRVDGKFIFNGDIPEGQGSVNELLAECFELNYDLRVAAESNAEDEDDAEDDATPGDATTPEVETDALANSLAESRLDAAPTTDTPTKA